MRPITCLNPQTVVNPYTGECLRVACHHCEACLNALAKRWIDKLETERRCWKYCYMVTLTYDDVHLPFFYADGVSLVSSRNGERIPFNDLNIDSPKDSKYFNSRINHRLGIPYACVDDVQLFHKRLNKYIHDKITKKYQNFRYFLVSEYGKDTFRPHYHGLYFFNSREIAANFKKILFTCWQNSDSFENGVTTDSVRGTASSYVAQYIRAFSDLPSIYRHKSLKPFYVFSKHPPIGSLQCNDEETKELFFSASPTRFVYQSKQNRFSSVRVTHSFENRLFPRLPKYSEIDLSLRARLYGFARESDAENFQEFKCFLMSFSDWCFYPDSVVNGSEYGSNLNKYLVWLTNGFRLDRYFYPTDESYNLVNNRVKRFYYVSSRVCAQSDVFGISVRNYVNVINQYYLNLENLKTRCFYETQENYTKAGHDVEDLSLMYDDPEKFLITNNMYYVPKFSDTFAFRDLSMTSKKIYNDSTKKHRSNEYLDKCRDKKLSLILKDYFSNV